MAYIKQLKDHDTSEKIYPITYIDAVIDNNATNVSLLLDNKLDKIPVSNIIPLTGLLPNVEYDFGTTDTVNIVLDTTNIDNTVANEWHFFFTAQTANCAVTLPNDVYLGNGYTWDIAAGRMFEVSIKHNIAYVGFCDLPSS